MAIDGPSAVVGTRYLFSYAYHYEQCLSRHEVIKLASCEPMHFYGTWLGSSGLYEVDIEANWDCDSLRATVQFDLLEVDTNVLQDGNTLIATASEATFQWIDCLAGRIPIPGATDSVFTPDTPGIYAVEVTQAGCTEQSPCRYLDPSTARESELANQIRLFPNPSAGQVQLDLSALTQPATLTLFDARGRQLMQQTALPQEISLDLRTWHTDSGLYFMRVQAGEQQAVLKVMLR
jgi:hypothetical protein